MADYDLAACPVPECDWHIEGPPAVVDDTMFILGGVVTHLRTHSDEERDAALAIVIDAAMAAAVNLLARLN